MERRDFLHRTGATAVALAATAGLSTAQAQTVDCQPEVNRVSFEQYAALQ